MPKINKIKLSGTSYDIQDSNASKTLTLTQAQYDALQTKDPNTFYIISDGETFDPSEKVDTSAFTAHTGDSTIHVTSTEKSTWNAKSNFSGSYNDLTNKPTIPSKTSDLTNDSNFATSGYVDSAVSGKANSSDVYTKSETSGATEISTALNAKLDSTAYTPTDLSNYYQKSETSGATQISTALSGKQDTLSAGTNITIVDNVISAEGSSITIDPSLDSGSTNPVANSAITNGINSRILNIYKSDRNWVGQGITSIDKSFNNSSATAAIFVASINQKPILGSSDYNSPQKFSLVETSAITTSITSGSTDSQVPSAKAVYDALGSASGGITSGEVQTMIDESISGKTDESAFTAHTGDSTVHTTSAEKSSWNGAATNASNAITALGGLSLIKITQSAYDALTTKDSNTLYVIVN